jgi:hypothetical protein
VALVVGLGLPFFWLVALCGFLSGTFLGIVATASVFSMAIPTSIIARRLNWKRRGALFAPIVFVALYYAVLKSTVVTLRQGGIRWRDTFYPLETLKAGNVT